MLLVGFVSIISSCHSHSCSIINMYTIGISNWSGFIPARFLKIGWKDHYPWMIRLDSNWFWVAPTNFRKHSTRVSSWLTLTSCELHIIRFWHLTSSSGKWQIEFCVSVFVLAFYYLVSLMTCELWSCECASTNMCERNCHFFFYIHLVLFFCSQYFLGSDENCLVFGTTIDTTTSPHQLDWFDFMHTRLVFANETWIEQQCGEHSRRGTEVAEQSMCKRAHRAFRANSEL